MRLASFAVSVETAGAAAGAAGAGAGLDSLIVGAEGAAGAAGAPGFIGFNRIVRLGIAEPRVFSSLSAIIMILFHVVKNFYFIILTANISYFWQIGKC